MSKRRTHSDNVEADLWEVGPGKSKPARLTKSLDGVSGDRTGQGDAPKVGAELAPWVDRLQDLVVRSGLRQAEIARRAGLQRDALGRYVRGLTRPPPAKLAAIARVLGVEPHDIDPDRRDLVGMAAPDTGPPLYRLTPARSGDSSRTYLEVAAEVDMALALRIVELVTKGQTG